LKLNLMAIGLIFVLIFSPLSAWALSANDVAGSLICNCGCGKLLNVCEMKTALDMKTVIQKKIDAGWSKKKILKYFVRMYGERILAAPTKKGFDLTAWITPFLVIAIGGVVIYLIIIKWVNSRKNGNGRDEFEKKGDGEVESEYEKKLDKELKEFDQ